jgi:hypothetical protein
MAIGIARFSWWLDQYIAGHCYHLGTAQNHRRAQAFIVGSSNGRFEWGVVPIPFTFFSFISKNDK